MIFLSVFRLFLNLQAANFFLKMDNFVQFTWKEAYWPFWIFFSIMIGLSFSVFLIMLTKLCAYVIFRKESSERNIFYNLVLTLMWLFYFIDGFTVMICLFVINSQNYLMDGVKKDFLTILTVFLVYSVLGIVFSSLIKNSLIEVMVSMGNEEDPLEAAATPRGQLEGTDPQLAVKKEKKVIEIPEFLFKYSSTFFKTATNKDVLFKKLFNQGKLEKKPDGATSDRVNKSTANEKGTHRGKSLKKTDLSMINFHLDIKQNEELLKQYR